MRTKVLLRYSLAIVAGVLLYQSFLFALPYGVVLYYKATGYADACAMDEILRKPARDQRFREIANRRLKEVRWLQKDAAGLEQYATSGRSFWIQPQGNNMNGAELLGYLLTDHEWLGEIDPAYTVQKGDVVLDVGGHIGVFADFALSKGASKVIMIEPEPRNAECIRRNFKQEIAEGRVVLVQEGAWDKESTLELHVSTLNSGMGSFVHLEGTNGVVKARVRRLDDIIAELGVDRINFIKMDIEGAEPQALRGAANILKMWKPRIMLDTYHEPGHAQLLPQIVTESNKQYKAICGPCEIKRDDEGLVPHVVFFL